VPARVELRRAAQQAAVAASDVEEFVAYPEPARRASRPPAKICGAGQRAELSVSRNPIAFFTTDRRAVSTFVTGKRSMR